MGAQQAGARNTKGFESAVRKGIIPSVNHITYAGAFNEQYFRVGLKSDKDLDLAIGVSNCNTPIDSGFLGTKNQFLSLFLKSSKDGIPRTQPIHAVLVLDISASMKEKLNNKETKGKDRLTLAREAIKLFYKRLRANDYFGLVLFEDRAKTIVPSQQVSSMNQEAVFEQIDAEVELGGTNLRAGLTEAEKHFSNVQYNPGKLPYERRIVMITDVNDNSLAAQDLFVAQLSASKVHCTIVGISDEFKSETCEKLVKIKGFNYFCATEESDLQTHLSDHFDYTFFPVASNIKIWLESSNVQGIDVYGTPDSEQVSTFGTPVGQNRLRFFLTSMNSSFPSEYKLDDQQQEVTKGGLIIVKMIPSKPTEQLFECTLVLQYENLAGEKQEQHFDVNYRMELDEYHSSETAEKAARIFYYVYCLRAVLERMNSDSRRLSFYNRRTYIQNLEHIKDIAPQNKRKDVDRLIELIERFGID